MHLSHQTTLAEHQIKVLERTEQEVGVFHAAVEAVDEVVDQTQGTQDRHVSYAVGMGIQLQIATTGMMKTLQVQ
jgi:hypothetical protein